MSYPFIHARYDYGTRKGPVLGFCVHMAEGGGTVGYLANDPARGVSVHYVIEYSGRIVQMLLETHASGSIDPTKIRTTNDADGFFGVTAAVSVLGSWARDPNSAVISLEIEGFASAGPNAAQKAALVALVDDVRSRYPGIGLLGHRDFQDYKPCPGRLIPWADLGGHGLPQEQPDMEWTNYVAKGEDWHPSVRSDASDAPVRLVPDRATAIAVRLPAGSTIRTIGEFLRGGENWRVTRLADGRTGFIIRGDLVPVTAGGDPAVDKPLLDYVQRLDTSAAAVTQALDHVQPAAEAVLTAIKEARPR